MTFGVSFDSESSWNSITGPVFPVEGSGGRKLKSCLASSQLGLMGVVNLVTSNERLVGEVIKSLKNTF